MAKKHGKTKLHGAALAAWKKKHGMPARKHNDPGPNPRGGRRRRRHNPGATFVQALGRVLGAAAAAFGTGVAVTYAAVKIAPGNRAAEYGIPAATALLGAAIATRMPLIGAGVAAGAAAPFVTPVAAGLLGPAPATPTSTTAGALRAVAMGSAWRELNEYPRPAGVGAVRMGAVYAD